MTSTFTLELQKLVFLIECYKTYPSPWLKNTSVIYRNKDGTFTDKSQILDFDKDPVPIRMDSQEYGEELSKLSEEMQNKGNVLTEENKNNLQDVLQSGEGKKLFNKMKEFFSNFPDSIKDSSQDILNNLETNIKSNPKSYLSIPDGVISSMKQSATIKTNPMENIGVGTSIFVGLDTLSRLTSNLKESIFSNLDIQDWSLGASLESMSESFSQLMKDSTTLENQKKIPAPLDKLIGSVHNSLISDQERKQEIMDLIEENNKSELSEFLPKNRFVDKLSEVGITESKEFLDTNEKFNNEGLNLMTLMDHAVKERDENQAVPLTKRLKQFKEGERLNKDLSWLKDYLKTEQKYGDLILESANAGDHSKQIDESYKKLIEELKSNTNGKMKIANPKRALTKEFNGKRQPMTDEAVKDFSIDLLNVEFEDKKYPEFRDTVNAGEDINPDVKQWLTEISNLSDIDTNFLPITAGEMDQDYVQNQKWVNEFNLGGNKVRREDNPLEYDETKFEINVPAMAIFTETFILGDYMNEEHSIPESSKRKVKEDTYHEYGHVIELTSPTIHKKAKDFLFERNNGNLVNQIEQGNGLQIDGDFLDSYTGRLYLNFEKNPEVMEKYKSGDLDFNDLNIKKSDILEGSTEVISSGTQRLSRPYNLKRISSVDRDHIIFVLSLITQS